MAAARAVAKAALLLAALATASCGFQPLHGTSPLGEGVSVHLASIDIVEQKTRLGQLIRNDLLSSMSEPGASGTRYRLALEAASRTHSTIEVENETEDTRRFSFRVNAAFRLLDARSGAELHRGKTFSQVSFDRTASDFSNLQAENDAMERAAHEIGNDIRTRLAAYFATHASAGAETAAQ
ncbi:MAG: LPS assembly lipoprotein LptE [Pseudomonadota bacterium]|nr:LPS assembly lipoprotein LptE [Pseudomonadota bacterium]